MRRAAWRAVGALALALAAMASCTLADLDGLAGDPVAPAGEGGVIVDASSADVASDARGEDAAAGDADAAACGSPGPTRGLLAYYPFDEDTGTTAHDCSGHGLDGRVVRQADAGSWAPGKHGMGLRVSAPDGCVDLGTPAALQPVAMSVAAWLLIDTFPPSGATGYVIGQSLNADEGGWRLGSLAGVPGLVGWQHTVAGTKYALQHAWTANAWHHLVLTFDGTADLEMFIDGVSVGTLGSTAPISYRGVSLRIGCRADDANFFDGTIDELRMYDRVLTEVEIASLAR